MGDSRRGPLEEEEGAGKSLGPQGASGDRRPPPRSGPEPSARASSPGAARGTASWRRLHWQEQQPQSRSSRSSWQWDWSPRGPPPTGHREVTYPSLEGGGREGHCQPRRPTTRGGQRQTRRGHPVRKEDLGCHVSMAAPPARLRPTRGRAQRGQAAAAAAAPVLAEATERLPQSHLQPPPRTTHRRGKISQAFPMKSFPQALSTPSTSWLRRPPPPSQWAAKEAAPLPD